MLRRLAVLLFLFSGVNAMNLGFWNNRKVVKNPGNLENDQVLVIKSNSSHKYLRVSGSGYVFANGVFSGKHNRATRYSVENHGSNILSLWIKGSNPRAFLDKRGFLRQQSRLGVRLTAPDRLHVESGRIYYTRSEKGSDSYYVFAVKNSKLTVKPFHNSTKIDVFHATRDGKFRFTFEKFKKGS